jgi:hypothetical protein
MRRHASSSYRSVLRVDGYVCVPLLLKPLPDGYWQFATPPYSAFYWRTAYAETASLVSAKIKTVHIAALEGYSEAYPVGLRRDYVNIKRIK